MTITDEEIANAVGRLTNYLAACDMTGNAKWQTRLDIQTVLDALASARAELDKRQSALDHAERIVGALNVGLEKIRAERDEMREGLREAADHYENMAYSEFATGDDGPETVYGQAIKRVNRWRKLLEPRDAK